MSFTNLFTPPRTSWVKAWFGKAALRSAIGAALAIGVLGAGQAQAVVVNVNGQNWNVTTFTGSYNDNTSKFNTAANGGIMPWWGNSTTANAFASAVGAALGYPNSVASAERGPFFAYNDTGGQGQAVTYFSLAPSVNPNSPSSFFGPRENSRSYAQADLATVPGPLPALGAAAAFGYSRTLRKRINFSKAVGASATAG